MSDLTSFILATRNEHKVKEIAAMLDIKDLRLISLDEAGFIGDIEETGRTFKENAWIKALAVYDDTGDNIIAEDSGLEVDALGGAPGIYSARYAGPQRNHDDNIDKLLEEMSEMEYRSARFRSVLAVIYQGDHLTFEGSVEGRIAQERMGSGGFGYDPVFIPSGFDKSFGQLPESAKNHLSHRARSFAKFQTFLRSTMK